MAGRQTYRHQATFSCTACGYEMADVPLRFRVNAFIRRTCDSCGAEDVRFTTDGSSRSSVSREVAE